MYLPQQAPHVLLYQCYQQNTPFLSIGANLKLLSVQFSQGGTMLIHKICAACTLHCLLISVANRLLGHDRAMAASHFIFHVVPRLLIPVILNILR